MNLKAKKNLRGLLCMAKNMKKSWFWKNFLKILNFQWLFIFCIKTRRGSLRCCLKMNESTTFWGFFCQCCCFLNIRHVLDNRGHPPVGKFIFANWISQKSARKLPVVMRPRFPTNLIKHRKIFLKTTLSIIIIFTLFYLFFHTFCSRSAIDQSNENSFQTSSRIKEKSSSPSTCFKPNDNHWQNFKKKPI